MRCNPLVSIIIPTFRRTDSLNRALKSCLIQSYSNIEVIIVDDNGCSIWNKKVEEIIKSFDDKRILLIRNESNFNGAKSRNIGIKNANGIYITFLDDDDIYLSDKVKRQVEYFEKFDINGLYCKVTNNNSKSIIYKSGDLTYDILLMNTYAYTPTLMFKKDILIEIGGFNESLIRHQDYDLLLKYFEKFRLDFLNEELVTLGENLGENIPYGEKQWQMKKNFFNSFQVVINKFDYAQRKKIYGKHFALAFLYDLKKRNFRFAFRYFRLAIDCCFYDFFNSIVNRIKLHIERL